MPRLAIKHENTIMYKIVCNDLSITDLYVGSTTNFTKRKYSHKCSCVKEGNEKYNSLWNSLRDSLWDSLGNSLGNSLRDSLRDSLYNSLWNSLGNFGWICFYATCSKLTDVKCEAKDAEFLKLHEEILASCFAMWVTDKQQIILCERPSYVEVVDGKVKDMKWEK